MREVSGSDKHKKRNRRSFSAKNTTVASDRAQFHAARLHCLFCSGFLSAWLVWREKHWHQHLTFAVDVLHRWHALSLPSNSAGNIGMLHHLRLSTNEKKFNKKKGPQSTPPVADVNTCFRIKISTLILISGSTQSQNMNIHRCCEVIKWNIQHVRDIRSVS